MAPAVGADDVKGETRAPGATARRPLVAGQLVLAELDTRDSNKGNQGDEERTYRESSDPGAEHHRSNYARGEAGEARLKLNLGRGGEG